MYYVGLENLFFRLLRGLKQQGRGQISSFLNDKKKNKPFWKILKSTKTKEVITQSNQKLLKAKQQNTFLFSRNC